MSAWAQALGWEGAAGLRSLLPSVRGGGGLVGRSVHRVVGEEYVCFSLATPEPLSRVRLVSLRLWTGDCRNHWYLRMTCASRFSSRGA